MKFEDTHGDTMHITRVDGEIYFETNDADYMHSPTVARSIALELIRLADEIDPGKMFVEPSKPYDEWQTVTFDNGVYQQVIGRMDRPQKKTTYRGGKLCIDTTNAETSERFENMEWHEVKPIRGGKIIFVPKIGKRYLTRDWEVVRYDGSQDVVARVYKESKTDFDNECWDVKGRIFYYDSRQLPSDMT